RVDGFDGRQFYLTPDNELVWQHVDLAMIRDVLTQIERRPTAERRRVYQLLAVTAVEQRISPIAAWYLERAARLLLYGLEVECVAMCRAVLEAALRFKLDPDELDKLGIERRGWNDEKRVKDFDLAGLILGAKRKGIWKQKDYDRASGIRRG